jgi:hypothetical protein
MMILTACCMNAVVIDQLLIWLVDFILNLPSKIGYICYILFTLVMNGSIIGALIRVINIMSIINIYITSMTKQASSYPPTATRATLDINR